MVYRINRDPIIDDNRVLRVDRMRVGSFSQSYQFQGSTSGYTSGGNPINPAGNIIDKYPFASNANATDVGDLTQKREVATGQSSGASGYTSGGRSPAYTNVIDKFPFSVDGNATDVGDLTGPRGYGAGQSADGNGYMAGGTNPPTW